MSPKREGLTAVYLGRINIVPVYLVYPVLVIYVSVIRVDIALECDRFSALVFSLNVDCKDVKKKSNIIHTYIYIYVCIFAEGSRPDPSENASLVRYLAKKKKLPVLKKWSPFQNCSPVLGTSQSIFRVVCPENGTVVLKRVKNDRAPTPCV